MFQMLMHMIFLVNIHFGKYSFDKVIALLNNQLMLGNRDELFNVLCNFSKICSPLLLMICCHQGLNASMLLSKQPSNFLRQMFVIIHKQYLSPSCASFWKQRGGVTPSTLPQKKSSLGLKRLPSTR